MPSTETKNADWIERPFIDLLCGAIKLSELSEQQKDDTFSTNLFANQAIINCALAVECAANCCLEAFGFPSGRLRDNIDKFSCLDKYEFLLFMRDPSKKVDRGSASVQSIQELINLRDKYVHSKVKQLPMSFRKTDSNKYEFETEFGTTNILKIPLIASHWKAEHAVLALGKIVEFFNYFFLDLCQFSAKDMKGFLLSKAVVDNNHLTMLSPNCHTILNSLKSTWNIQVHFLDFSMPTI
jgi:hypothetical protein